MDIYEIAKNGTPDVLLAEALPSISSSATIFANAPANTRIIMVTLRGAGMTLNIDTRDDSTPDAATASGNGHDYDYGTPNPHVFAFDQKTALKCRAIQTAATATGWITYWGK